MDDRIKAAFDSIHAEESLKQNTIARLRQTEDIEGRPRRYRIPPRRLTVAFACLLLFMVIGITAFNSYNTDAAWLDVDINPSIGLTINQFGRVIGAESYNSDGEQLLDGLSLRHRPYDKAMQELVDAAWQMGYLQSDGLVSVSLSAGGSVDDAALLERTQDVVSSALPEASAQVDVFLVDEDTRGAAHDHHITPARYLAILELQEVDPAATLEECRNHSLQELREQTAAHHNRRNRHHAAGRHS